MIDPTAVVGKDCQIGPFCYVGPKVTLGDRCQLLAHVTLLGPSSFGPENRFFPGACLGADPQDLKYAGEESFLSVGHRNTFREGCTVHRGTADQESVTTIGSNGLYMAQAHVAHDCTVGDQVVFANSATLAGHVSIGDHATVGAFSAVHQFTKVGIHGFIGGFSVVTRHALPYVKTVGARNEAKARGINAIGLERRGFSPDAIKALKTVYRALAHRTEPLAEVIPVLQEEWKAHAHALNLLNFVAENMEGRGVIAPIPSQRP